MKGIGAVREDSAIFPFNSINDNKNCQYRKNKGKKYKRRCSKIWAFLFALIYTTIKRTVKKTNGRARRKKGKIVKQHLSISHHYQHHHYHHYSQNRFSQQHNYHTTTHHNHQLNYCITITILNTHFTHSPLPPPANRTETTTYHQNNNHNHTTTTTTTITISTQRCFSQD